MWHLTVTHISANLPTASTNNWDSRDLDTETRLVRTLTSSHLSFPSPSWLLASRDIFMIVAPPLCALLSSFLPPFSTCKVCPMSTYYADLGPHMYAVHVRPPHHTITHPTALLPPTDETISRNLYRPHLPTHRAYSFSCFVSSELSWYVQPDTKTYQVTIWRRLSPTDINVGTWVFVNNFGKKGLWRKYFNERKYPIWVMSITQKLS